MTTAPRFFAALTFVAIAIFLVGYSWVPARDGLQIEAGQISQINPRPNTWYEVEILASSGARLTCRARRGWPALGPDRCPIEKFEACQGCAVTVVHDGKRPYEVIIGDQLVMAYSSHRQAQAIAIVLAALMLAMACRVWRRQDR